MAQSIKSKTAIVTGAGSGINLAFAEQLLEGGCNVLFADLSLRPEAQKVVEKHTKPQPSKGRAVFQETDVRDWKQLERMFVKAEAEFGEVHIVCPGAGVYEPNFSNFWYPPGTPQSRDDIKGNRYALLDINLVHPIRTSQLAIAHFLNSQSGPKTIIIISSTSAQDTCFATPLYDASKHAITGFVRALSKLESKGIRIAAVAPGIIKTPLYTDNPDKLAMIDAVSDVWVEPSEVATVMVALIEQNSMSSKISEAATGKQDINISGGTILEVTKDRARVVTAYHDPGPSGAGAIASNVAATEDAAMAILVPGWGGARATNGVHTNGHA